MKRRSRTPSPAFVISLAALFVALGGTSLAASKVSAAKHKDAKADTKLIKKLAPSLSVKHAKTANSAKTAASADSATNATTAANANALQGKSKLVRLVGDRGSARGWRCRPARV
jgi:hypothetical protein